MSNPTLRLSICGGPHNGETFESNNDEVLIGRGLVNRSQEITFENDDEVSSVHFVLQFKFNGRGRNKWSVRDLNSSNGTYVNGKRLQGGNQRILRGKDVVHFGRSEAKYHGGRHPTLELLEHLEHQSETPCRRLLSLDPESQDTYVFGRVPLQTTTNVNLELDDQVSSEHATIFSENSEFFIKDLSSLNGTKVNIQSLRAGETIHLSPGDMIAVGNTYMSFAPHLSSSPVSLHAAAMLLLGTHQKKRRGGDGGRSGSGRSGSRSRSGSIGRRRGQQDKSQESQDNEDAGEKSNTPDQKRSGSPAEYAEEGGREEEEDLFSPRHHHFTRRKKKFVMKTVRKNVNGRDGQQQLLLDMGTPTLRQKDRLLSELVDQKHTLLRNRATSTLTLAASPSRGEVEEVASGRGRGVALSFDENDIMGSDELWDNHDEHDEGDEDEEGNTSDQGDQKNIQITVAKIFTGSSQHGFWTVARTGFLLIFLLLLSFVVLSGVFDSPPESNVGSTSSTSSTSSTTTTTTAQDLAVASQALAQRIQWLENETGLLSNKITRARRSKEESEKSIKESERQALEMHKSELLLKMKRILFLESETSSMFKILARKEKEQEEREWHALEEVVLEMSRKITSVELQRTEVIGRHGAAGAGAGVDGLLVESKKMAEFRENIDNLVSLTADIRMNHGGVQLPNYAWYVSNKPSTCNGVDDGRSPFDASCGVNVHRLLTNHFDWHNCWHFSGKHRIQIQLSSCHRPTKVTVRGWNGEYVGERYQQFPHRINSLAPSPPLAPSGTSTSSKDTLTTFSFLEDWVNCTNSVSFELDACDPARADPDCVSVVCGLMVH